MAMDLARPKTESRGNENNAELLCVVKASQREGPARNMGRTSIGSGTLWKRITLGGAGFLAVLALWEIYVRLGNPPTTVGPPRSNILEVMSDDPVKATSHLLQTLGS